MNWNKIDIKSIMKVLRSLDENSPNIHGKHSVVYSDGKEEIKITYRRIKEFALK